MSLDNNMLDNHKLIPTKPEYSLFSIHQVDLSNNQQSKLLKELKNKNNEKSSVDIESIINSIYAFFNKFHKITRIKFYFF